MEYTDYSQTELLRVQFAWVTETILLYREVENHSINFKNNKKNRTGGSNFLRFSVGARKTCFQANSLLIKLL